MNQKLPPIFDFLATLTSSTTKVENNEKPLIDDNVNTITNDVDSSIPATIPVLTESPTLGALFSARPDQQVYEPTSDILTNTTNKQTNNSKITITRIYKKMLRNN